MSVRVAPQDRRAWREGVSRDCTHKYFDGSRHRRRPGHALCGKFLPIGKRCTFAACPLKKSAETKPERWTRERALRWSMEGQETWPGWRLGPLAAIRWHGEWYLLHVASEHLLAGWSWRTLGALKVAAERVVALDVWGFNRDQALLAQAGGAHLVPPEVAELLRGAPGLHSEGA